MKKLITNYTFDASAKTVNFNDYTGSFDIKGLLLIVNITDNITIYNFAVDGVGYTAIDDDLVTLEYNTTSMDDADKLLIYYDDGANQVVELGSTDNAVLDAIEATANSIQTSVESLDNAVDGNYLNTNLNIAGTDVDGNSGNKSAQTQRVVIATDDIPIAAVNSKLDHLSDNLDTLEATANSIQTAVEVLDDWDDSNYANVNINLAGTDAPTGGGAESGALRVTIANDSTGVLTIDDGGGAITVDGTITANAGSGTMTVDGSGVTQPVSGTVTVNAGTNLNTSALATHAKQDTIIGHIDGIETLLGTIDADTNAIKTAVQILDDWDDSNYANINMNIAGADVDGGSGDKSAQSQRVVIATDDIPIALVNTNLAAIEATLETIKVDTEAIETAVELLDNAISGNEMQVDVVTMPSITVDSELPAAATSADNFANPSTTNIMSMGMVYDGSTWDRTRGDATNGLLVNLGSNNDVTVTGTVTANLSATDNAVLDAIDAVLDTIKVDTEAIETAVEAIQAGQLSNGHNVVVTSAPTTTVTGTVTANAGTNLNTSALATHAKQDTVIGHVDGIETLLGTIDADTGAIKTAVETLDNAIDGSEMQVDIVSAPTITVDGTVAVTHAALTELGTAINANDQVDVNIASGGFDGAVTNAGLTELASAINSDKVDVNISSGGFDGAVTNSGLTALDAAIGTDGSTGPAKAISIAGTHSGDLQEIAVDASGNVQVDIVSTVSTYVQNTGTFSVQVTGAALVALQLLDDIVLAEDSSHNSADKGIMPLAVRNDDLAALGGADGDYSPLQVNSSGALYVSIDDGGNTITVDGTVTANLSATDNAVLDAIDSVLDTIKVDTEAIETAVEAIQVDAAAIEVLLAAANVDHAANEALLATIDADTGAIKTAVELIDNAIDGSEMQVDVVASLPAGTNNIGDVDIASALPAGDNNIGNVDIASAIPAGDNNIGNVDIASSLPAGSNAIGKLAANSGVDIGDVDVTSTVQPVGHGTVSHVAQNVTDSAVQLGSNACKHVDIMATIANTGIVYIGASGVSATTGIALYPGDVYSVDITNTNLLYTISTVSGDDINMVIYS